MATFELIIELIIIMTIRLNINKSSIIQNGEFKSRNYFFPIRIDFQLELSFKKT